MYFLEPAVPTTFLFQTPKFHLKKANKTLCDYILIFIFFSGWILWWRLGLANHNSCLNALSHFLPLSFNCVLVWNLEEILQIQISSKPSICIIIWLINQLIDWLINWLIQTEIFRLERYLDRFTYKYIHIYKNQMHK